jgi:hypothetical protein
VSHTRRKQDD